MRIATLGLLLVGLSAQAGLSALADDANSDRPIQTHKQMMKDCMAKEKSSGNGASDEDLRRICRDKIKSYDNHPSETTPPPNNPGV
jgi:hypothetical protein